MKATFYFQYFTQKDLKNSKEETTTPGKRNAKKYNISVFLLITYGLPIYVAFDYIL